MEKPMGDLELRIEGLAVGSTMDSAETPEAVLEQAYDDYARPLYRYALAVTGSSEDAEDAVQEVFVRLARATRGLSKVGDLKSYLFSAARNSAYSILRSRQRSGRLNDALESQVLVESQYDAAGSCDQPALREAMAALPLDQREVLVLKVFDEMTFQEIADTIGASINTVASRYRYAVAKLREALGTSP
jgi:RNA polymerase sigma-70 factor, ECF subfamily